MYEFDQLLENVRDSRFGFDRLNLERDVHVSNADVLKQKYAMLQEQMDKGIIPQAIEHPLGCQLELTYRCNSRCIHCYNDSSVERHKSAQELTQEQWLDVARQFCEMGVFQAVLSGGEPLLLRDRLFEIMDVFHAHGVVFLLITNGSMVTPKVVQRMVDKGYRFGRVQVSIDADTPEIHDHLRGHPGSWAKATRAVRLFAEAGLPTMIAHTVFRNNLGRFQEMADLAVSLGARAIITGPCMPSGRAAVSEECQGLLLDTHERDRFMDEVERAKKRLAHVRRGRPLRVIPSAGVAISLRVRVIEPSRALLVRPDGTVKVDCVLPFSLGNVRDSSLRTIWQESGNTVWRHPKVLEYISNIESEEHLLKEGLPRPHIDNNLRIR